MSLEKFKGVFCALNAIYDENDNIDVEKIKALVRVYKSLGVKGVYACGSTGEGFLLSTEERKQVAKAERKRPPRRSAGRAPSADCNPDTSRFQS